MDSKIRCKSSKVVSCLLAISILGSPTSAAGAAGVTGFNGLGQPQQRETFGQEVQGLGSAVSEYFYRRDRDDVLVPVYMLGEVAKPGIYHVPVKSNLVTLFSLAGGLSPDADHGAIHLRDSRTPEPVRVSMKDILKESRTANSRLLLGNEVIYVEKSEAWISNNTMLVIGFLSGLAGIFLAAKAVSK
jgi:hypothetical protein